MFIFNESVQIDIRIILIIEKFLALIRIDLLYVKRFTCCYVFQGMLDYVM